MREHSMPSHRREHSIPSRRHEHSHCSQPRARQPMLQAPRASSRGWQLPAAHAAAACCHPALHRYCVACSRPSQPHLHPLPTRCSISGHTAICCQRLQQQRTLTRSAMHALPGRRAVTRLSTQSRRRQSKLEMPPSPRAGSHAGERHCMQEDGQVRPGIRPPAAPGCCSCRTGTPPPTSPAVPPHHGRTHGRRPGTGS